MQLNLPIVNLLENSQSILIAGAGGGFDVYGALPLYFTLREMGKTVHLASYSFSDVALMQMASRPEILVDQLLVGTQGRVLHRLAYLPECYLTEWFLDVLGETVPVWTFQKVGAKALHDLYEKLVQHLAVDAIILVDGGVDSIMRGNEDGCGTILEDTVSLCAVSKLDVPTKILACLGFGTELEVKHSNALRNMAELIQAGAFWGSCALTPQMQAFEHYKQACTYTFEQPGHHKSHIQTHVISAGEGQFDNFHRYQDGSHYVSVFVSALMLLYWFFDASIVHQRSYIAPLIQHDEDIFDSWATLTNYLKTRHSIPAKKIPY